MNKMNAAPDRDLLFYFEHVALLAENSGMNDAFLAEVDEIIQPLAQRLQLTPVQAVLMAVFMTFVDDDNVRMSDIAGYLDCKPIPMLRYGGDIDELERRFLYKVKFEAPTPEARRSIWKAMIPTLAD